MKSTLIAGCIALALVGCGEDSELQNLVRAKLNNPDSLQFGNVEKTVKEESENFACVEYKKEGMSDFHIARLGKYKNSKWEVQELEAGSICLALVRGHS